MAKSGGTASKSTSSLLCIVSSAEGMVYKFEHEGAGCRA